MRKFPFMPTSAAVVSDRDGNTIAIFFPHTLSFGDEEERVLLKSFLLSLLKANNIEPMDIREVGKDE